MPHNQSTSLPWPRAVLAVCRAWKPLLAYELLMSLLATTTLGPLLLAGSYRLIGISDELVWSNWEIASHLTSVRGIMALVLGSIVIVGLFFLEYFGLILLADAALRGTVVSVSQLVIAMLRAAARLFFLAAVFSILTILVTVPFIGLAALAYWLLLSGSDPNYYLTMRPLAFWAAAVAGLLVVAMLAGTMIWLFARWAFAVPACVVDRCGWRLALRSSSTLMRGRTWRFLAVLGAWQLLRSIALGAALVALDRANAFVMTGADWQLSMALWRWFALLLVDMILMQLIASMFAIGTAALIGCEYEQARLTNAHLPPDTDGGGLHGPLATSASWRARALVLAIVVAGPSTSILYAWRLALESIEHRPARVTAHRAGPKPAPENSLAALRLALKAGADFVELDVQQTADGHVVLLHDRDLRRVTGDPRGLNELTLADLETLWLRGSAGPSHERIPTLAEFLAACGEHVRLNVELKETTRNPRLAAAVTRILREHGFTSRAAVSCFELPPLLEARALEPSLPIGIILTAVKGDMTRLPVNFLSLNQRLVQPSVVRRAHQRGMEVHVWTVNDRASALRLLDLGCDNLITSDPALMREVVDWYAGLSDLERILLRLRRWARE